ncbi:MAG: lipid A biosynthesis acyltransferase [Betaproteobacteria bacterium]|nr:lipid A biosynthesis acyltransferase [Betaproteobacteria bacterium]
MKNVAAYALLGLVWLLHWLPLPLLALLGRGFGLLLHAVGGARRRVALRNVALCFPELNAPQQAALVREHFQWLGRSLLERGVLWHASRERLKRLIQVEGEPRFAEGHKGAVMWLAPHFLGIEIAGMATQLYQQRTGFDVYAPQSNAVLDAALLAGRGRFGTAEFFTRSDGARAIVRAIRRGLVFFNPPDMDFGLRDAAFVPFFGQPAATLLAPSRLAKSLAMTVQPVVADMLPGGQGYRVRFLPPWTDWPTDDPLADAARMNSFIEQQVRLHPAQYFWVHKRFKTRPEGAPPVYD